MPSCNTGRIVQINISPQGGMPKKPLTQAEIGPLGIIGDGHRYRLHGGPQKAILLIAAEVVDTLIAEGWPLFYGALGENFTTRGINHRTWRTGQQFRCGTAVLLQLTTPREPCQKLNPYGRGMQKRLLLNPGESGFYASVLQGGTLTPNAIIESVERFS